MPTLGVKEFTELLRGMPEGASQDQINQAASAAEAGSPLEQIWAWANKPLAGSADALIPALRHEHGPEESGIRKGVEDFGATLTSPVSLGTMSAGIGAGVAGKAGKFGISKAARYVEAGLQAPFAAEGLKNVVEGETPGQKLAGAAQAGMAGVGMRSALTHAFDPKAVVDQYMTEKGLTRQVREPYTDAGAIKTADNYAAMPHEPQNPAVKASYESLGQQVDEQHAFLADRAGVKIEPWTGEGEPYPLGSKQMQEDVVKNNHLYFLPTDKSQILSDHPMAQGEANNKFRAVHDYMGHAAEGNSFGPKGEQGAYNAHRDTLTPDAHGALATETKGQNSWVNANPALRNPEGGLVKKGEPGFVPLAERPFAEQKAGLLPEFHAAPDGGPAPSQTSAPDATGRSASKSTSQSPQPSAAQLALSSELLADVNARHAQTGGSSTNLVIGKAVSPQEGRYLVSPFEDRQLVLDKPPTDEDLAAFAQKNSDLLSKPGHNLGTWFNAEGDKKHYIDVAIGNNDLETALELGRQHKQKAIYDLVEGKDIPVGAGTPGPGVGTKLLSSAGLTGATQIDDSDPNDPNYTLKHYGKLALTLGSLYGLGNTAAGAYIRKNPQSAQKLAASKGAALFLLGGSKKQWTEKMLAEGVDLADMAKVHAGAQKLFSQQVDRVGGQMVKTKELMKHFENGKGDLDWYNVGNELKEYFGKDAELFAQLLAVTSNNATVPSNHTFALKAYKAIKAGLPILKKSEGAKPGEAYLPAVVDQIRRVAAGQGIEGIEGRKVNDFVKALMGDKNAVVVDRWMMRAFGYEGIAPTPHEYDLIEHTVRELAKQQGVEPRQMQAAIWFGAKQSAEAGKGRAPSPTFGELTKQKLQGQLPTARYQGDSGLGRRVKPKA